MLARPDNDFVWSSWEDGAASLRELDEMISRVEAGDLSACRGISFLFLPTGDIGEVAISSGWSDAYLRLAARVDAAIAIACR